MFLTSLPIVFTYTHWFNAIEAIFFLGLIFCLIYFYAPATGKWKESPCKNWYHLLLSAWLGNVALWRAFWPFFALLNGIFLYIDYRAGNSTYTIASWKTVHIMIFLPSIWWAVSVWRCSHHTSNSLWAAAARSVTIYFFLDFTLRLLISLFYPQTLFDCKLMLLEYGDCL